MTRPDRAWLDDVEAARRAGDLDAMLALARDWRRAAPDQPAPAFLLCRMLLERRDPEANAILNDLDRFPAYAPGWEALGHSLERHHPAAARIAFARAAKAYEAAKPCAEIDYRLGAVLRRLGDRRARAALDRAVAADPAHAPAWFTLGLARQDDGDRPGAMQAFRSALEAQPAHHEAAFNLAVALQEDGRMEAALDQYAMAWRLRPDSFGRVAQALASPGCGRLWLDPDALRQDLAARA